MNASTPARRCSARARLIFRALVTTILALAVLTGPVRATASTYPDHAIKIVYPYPAGGSGDSLARWIAKMMQEWLGQPVIVENRSGASGMIGNEYVARADADGYTLLLSITTMIQAPALYKKQSYDVQKDFMPLALVALTPNMLVVPKESPINTLADFIALVKREPAKHSYGSFGFGTSAHIQGELLKSQAGLDLVHVPYQGSAPLLTNLMGNQVDAGFVDASTGLQHVLAGKLKVLAITGSQRYEYLPEVPTFAEAGYKDFDLYGWWAMFLPAGTTPEIAEKLTVTLHKIFQSKAFAQRCKEMGIIGVGGTPAELAAIIQHDEPVWRKIITESQIKLE